MNSSTQEELFSVRKGTWRVRLGDGIVMDLYTQRYCAIIILTLMSALGPQGRQAELNECFATTLTILADTHYLLAKRAISAFGARKPETWLIPN